VAYAKSSSTLFSLTYNYGTSNNGQIQSITDNAYNGRRVAQPLDLVGITSTEGCPVLRVLCEGREPERRDPKSILLRALFRGHRVECHGFLFNVVASAMRAPHLLAIVLVEREYPLEGFMAVVAEIIVHGHETPPVEFAAIVTPPGNEESCDFLADARHRPNLRLSSAILPLPYHHSFG